MLDKKLESLRDYENNLGVYESETPVLSQEVVVMRDGRWFFLYRNNERG